MFFVDFSFPMAGHPTIESSNIKTFEATDFKPKLLQVPVPSIISSNNSSSSSMVLEPPVSSIVLCQIMTPIDISPTSQLPLLTTRILKDLKQGNQLTKEEKKKLVKEEDKKEEVKSSTKETKEMKNSIISELSNKEPKYLESSKPTENDVKNREEQAKVYWYFVTACNQNYAKNLRLHTKGTNEIAIFETSLV
jgi:hypothetical protein